MLLPASTTTSKRVLLVEKKAIQHDIIQMCLTEFSGWNVERASSILEAQSRAKLADIDAIILSFSLSESEVLWFAQQLRMQPETREVPMLVPALRATWFDSRLLEPYQVKIVVVNPFEIADLPLKIANLLGWD